MNFLQCKTKVEASSQAMIAIKRRSGYLSYSQKVSKQIAGLHLTACFGVENLAEMLIENGADINTQESYGRMPLLWAAEGGHKVLVRLLLEKGADIKSKDTSGRTPLSHAAEKGHEARRAVAARQGD